MKFVSVKMIAAHVGRSPQAVARAIKLARIEPERRPGVKGLRLTIRQAEDLIGLNWPQASSMKEGAK